MTNILVKALGKVFRPPCPHLCNKLIVKTPLQRFHFTCLTCPIRREAYGKTTHYKRYPRVIIVLESASGKGILVPEHYRSYGLMIDLDSHFIQLKSHVLKLLMTLAERIAEW